MFTQLPIWKQSNKKILTARGNDILIILKASQSKNVVRDGDH